MGAIESARDLGADAVQIWASNPRQWAHPHIHQSQADEFRAAWRESGLGPLVIHAPVSYTHLTLPTILRV